MCVGERQDRERVKQCVRERVERERESNSIKTLKPGECFCVCVRERAKRERESNSERERVERERESQTLLPGIEAWSVRLFMCVREGESLTLSLC